MRSSEILSLFSKEREIQFIYCGLQDYQETLALQYSLVEHPPVITVGRKRNARRNILDPGEIPVIEVERGGDVTYHTPGQLVGYPILLLEPDSRDLHRYLRDLEDLLIRLLAVYGIGAERNPPYTGVWHGGRKLASIGVAVHAWVTLHGFALNVNNDPAEFTRIHPCGLPAEVMGSVAQILGHPVDLGEMKKTLRDLVCNPFPPRVSPPEEAQLSPCHPDGKLLDSSS
ncbi:MAG: lipoyl(octanoyl) transferase [Deltaproteobacteria bacterium]|nr:MAG: lipoyl(octanoyl) transferase [Deltaproteobacteria bacterium]